MFTLIVRFKVSAEHRERFTSALTKVRAQTQDEIGNVVYEFSIDENDPLHFYLYEKYIDRKGYEFHTQQEYLQKFREEIQGALVEPPTVIRGFLEP